MAWSPHHTPVQKKVTVEDGKVLAEFELKRRPDAPQHSNKDGEAYGRYK